MSNKQQTQSAGAQKSVAELRRREESGMDQMPPPASTALSDTLEDPTFGIMNPQVFEHLWRVGTALANSQLVPQQFRQKPEDCFIATQMALSLHCQPLQVLQNLYIVHGSPGFSAKFAIALANSRGPFEDVIHFKTIGEKGKPSFGVTASAVIKKTGRVVERTVTMDMAEKEGWTSNKKYQSIPEQMLSYRAATFLIRLYCPEVLLGMATSEELEDTGGYIDGRTGEYVRPVGEDEDDYSGGEGTTLDLTDEEAQEFGKPAPQEAEPEKPRQTATEAATQPAAPQEPEPDGQTQPPPGEGKDEPPPEKLGGGPSFADVMAMVKLADKTDSDLSLILENMATFKGHFHQKLHDAVVDKFGAEMVRKVESAMQQGGGQQQSLME